MTAAVLIVFSCLAAPPTGDGGLERYEATQRHMGVEFRIVLYAPNQETAEKGSDAAFERIAQLNRVMSDYDPESELSRLSRSSPTSRPVKVSDDLWRVLHHAQKLSERTEGAFDVTVGPLTKLWRRARRQKKLPQDPRFSDARKAVGYKLLSLDQTTQSVSLRQPNMRLDLGGIAKGFAADEALGVLRKHGITRALVNASGDIAMGDAPVGEVGWRIGVAPLDAGAAPSRFLRLANCAIATSGDAWQYVEIDGTRYSHIIDPHTGLGLTSRSSVTVIAPDCTSGDALASAVSVLGIKKGLALIEDIANTSALIVHASETSVMTQRSNNFPNQ